MVREPNIRSELLPSGVQCLGYEVDGAWLRGRGPRKTPLDPPPNWWSCATEIGTMSRYLAYEQQ